VDGDRCRGGCDGVAVRPADQDHARGIVGPRRRDGPAHDLERRTRRRGLVEPPRPGHRGDDVPPVPTRGRRRLLRRAVRHSRRPLCRAAASQGPINRRAGGRPTRRDRCRDARATTRPR
jgi:hypothetical protein